MIRMESLKSVLSILLLGILVASDVIVLPVEADAAVAILSHSGYLDSWGYYHVVGEVQNVGDKPVTLVKVEVTFYDYEGTVIDSRFDLAMLNILLVDAKSPFEIVLLDAIQSALVDHYSLNVTFSATDPIPIGLEILSHTSYVDEVGSMHIVGEIKNIGTKRARNVKVIATYYDETGTVVAAAFAYQDPEVPEIEPNQTAPFEILLSEERTPYVASHELTAESSEYAIVRTLSINDFNRFFSKNKVRIVYPSESHEKPFGRSPAMVSDWLASAFVYTKLENVTEGLDTDSNFVNQTSGDPIGESSVGIVSFGGPVVSVPVYYYEVNRISPVVYCGVPGAAGPGEPWSQWYLANRTAIPETAIGTTDSLDLFVIEMFLDLEGRYVFITYGIGWRGTYAAGKYFDKVVYPNLDSYTSSWIIVKWEDTNGDGFINAPGDGDTYTSLASGS